jgi:phosphate transport system protein
MDAVRSGLDHELMRMREDILRMGSLVESCISWALGDGNESPRGAVMDAHRRTTMLRERIERIGLATLATQHPTARDLRRVVAALHIAHQLVQITRHCAAAIEQRSSMPIRHRLCRHIASMLHGSMDAFVRSDARLAVEVVRRDEVVDEARAGVVEGIFKIEAAGRSVEERQRIYWIEHHVERIGDCVVNICDRIVFDVTGRDVRAVLAETRWKSELDAA